MGGGGSSSSSNVIPAELSRLYSQSASRMLQLQQDLPLSGAPAYNRQYTGPGTVYDNIGNAPPPVQGTEPVYEGDIPVTGQDPGIYSRKPIQGSQKREAIYYDGMTNPNDPNGGSAGRAGGWGGDAGDVTMGGPETPRGPDPRGYMGSNAMGSGQYGFIAPAARGVAGQSELEQFGAGKIQGMFDRPQSADAGINAIQSGGALQRQLDAQTVQNMAQSLQGHQADYAGRLGSNVGQVSAAGQSAISSASGPTDLNIDRELAAAKANYESNVRPDIANSMNAMGLGRSGAHGQAQENAWAANVLPIIQEGYNRGERRQDATTSAIFGASDRAAAARMAEAQGIDAANFRNTGAVSDARFRQGGNIAESQYRLGDTLRNQAQVDTARQFGTIDEAMRAGGTQRGIQDARYGAEYDDFVRRQALAENALYQPFGGASNMIGTSSTTSGK